jgi:hypothetical protein
VRLVTEDDLEAFIKHLTRQGRASSTRNHYASLQQTSTYLNATLRGLHESMRNLDQSRPARKQAPALNGKSLIH